MKINYLSVFFSFICIISFSQDLFNSQSIYDTEGELFYWGEVRDININFYDIEK